MEYRNSRVSHDEETGLERTEEHDFAPYSRTGTRSSDDASRQRPASHRTQSGGSSVNGLSSAPGTRPTSRAQSTADTHASRTPRGSRYGSVAQSDTRSDRRGSQVSSAQDLRDDFGTRPNSFEGPNLGPGRQSTFESEKQAEPKDVQGQHSIQTAEDLELSRWLVESHRNDLFDISHNNPTKDGPKSRLKINIASLQRMRMRKLQVKLARDALHMRYQKTEPEGWEDLLQEYIDAVKEYDFVRTCVNRGIDDPFVVITERIVDAGVLRSLLKAIPQEDRKEDGLETIDLNTFAAPSEATPQPIGGTRLERTQKQNLKDFITRLEFSLAGGIFLIAPMWLMVLHNTKWTALVSTSAFVLAWGLLAAWKLGDTHLILSTTAAYAAVLVVFVGTNSPGEN